MNVKINSLSTFAMPMFHCKTRILIQFISQETNARPPLIRRSFTYLPHFRTQRIVFYNLLASFDVKGIKCYILYIHFSFN